MDLPVRSPKLALSTAEWQLAFEDQFILTKHRIIAEVYEIFGCLADEFRELAKPLAMQYPQAFAGHPKISKGEQYEQMPWVMLDYPRCFDTEGHFAIRCFFWWGQHFSIRLHTSGKYATAFSPAVLRLGQKGWMTGWSSDPWDYQLPNTRWKVVGQETPENGWLLAAQKIPVTNWSQAFEFYRAAFADLMQELMAD